MGCYTSQKSQRTLYDGLRFHVLYALQVFWFESHGRRLAVCNHNIPCRKDPTELGRRHVFKFRFGADIK